MQRKASKKPKRGRPATGHDDVITVRLPKALIRRLDKAAAAESKSRSEVIRALLDPNAEFDRRFMSELIKNRLNGRLSDEMVEAKASALNDKQRAKMWQTVERTETQTKQLARRELRAAIRRSKLGKPNV